METEETVETTETETSLRDDIESSLAELTAGETPEPAPEVESPEPAPVTERDDGRDERGRFKSKAASPAGAAEPAAGEKPAEVAPTTPAGPPAPVEPPAPAPEPVERAPQSWKPLAREHWAKLPSEVRQEVARREQETSRVLQESAEARKGYAQFQEAIRPFEAMIRAEAGDPIRGVQNLLGFAYQLRTGSPQQKAGLIAQAIQAYGVSVEDLANVLEGSPAARQAAVTPQYDPRVDQLFQQLQSVQEQAQQRSVAAARAQLEEARAGMEFYEDLREPMADWLEVYARRGQHLTLKQAYDKALAGSEEHQKIIKQREAAKAAASASAQAQRAKVASSSVRSTPAVAPPRSRADTSLREDLEETLRELQGR